MKSGGAPNGKEALLRNGKRPGAKLFKALLRNAFKPLFQGTRRLAQWMEALSRNGRRPGAKLFKALLRNAFAPLFQGTRRLAQWMEALSRNGRRPGAKLFKALLRNAFKPFFAGLKPDRRGNARKEDGPPSFSFFSSPKGNLPARFRPETYGALLAAFASFPDFWRRMDWRRR